MIPGTHHISRWICIFIILGGGLVIVNQVFNLNVFQNFLTGFKNTKFNTALGLLCGGVALYIQNQPYRSQTGKWISNICISIIFIIALLSLSQYIFGWNIEIDGFLLKNTAPVLNEEVARMPVFTAILLLVLGFVLYLIPKPKYQLLVQGIVISCIVIVAIIFLASLSIAGNGNTSPLFLKTIINSRLLFLMLFAAALLSYPLRNLRFSFKRKMAGIFLLISLGLAIIFYSFHRNNIDYQETSRMVAQSNEVLYTTELVRAGLAEIQSGVRGFLVSADEEFLPLFYNSASEIGTNINHLKKLTTGTPGMQANLIKLESIVNEYIRSRNELIELQKTSGLGDAQIQQGVRKGKNETDDARALIINLQKEQEKLLVKRKAENEINSRNSSRTITVFQVLTALLLMGALLIAYGNTNARNKAEAEIILLNATLEKRVEEKTREVVEKENQYRFLLENMREGIQLIGQDWKYLFVNNSLISQGKFFHEDLVGHTMMEAYPGIENTELFKVLQHCMRDRESRIFENEFTFPDGSKAWFELSIQPVPEGLFILSMDISKRKLAEQNLLLSEEKYRMLFYNNPMPMWMYSRENLGILDVNTAAINHYGYTKEEFLKMTIEDLRPADDTGKINEYISNRNNDMSYAGIWTHRKKNGETIYVDIISHSLVLEGKELRLVLSHDVTEKLKTEEEKKRYAAELESSNVELEQFAYIASHDLQEPLRMVSSFMGLLKEELGNDLSEEHKQYLDFAVDGSDRMKILIQDLLQYSRVNSNKDAFTQININEIVQYSITLLQKEIQESGAEIRVKDMPMISGNKTLITQLFVNLINNAIKYRGAGPPVIDIGYNKLPDTYTFYIQDNGIGIDPKFFDKIFTIFQRLHSKSQYSGTGIGLAICKKIVEIHKGKIWVESEPGNGSCFYFTIPK